MKYFGTDGIRGKNEFFTNEFLKKAGYGAAKYINGGAVLIARDTRTSGKFIAGELTKALAECGITVYDAGMTATPVCAFLTKKFNCGLGIMISASHNPPEYNGIKYFASNGGKITDEERMEECIDSMHNSQCTINNCGKIIEVNNGDDLYIDYIKTASGADLSGMRVVLDTANGATSLVAPKLFKALGAEVKQIFNETDGININRGCGAMHLEAITDALKGEPKGTLGLSYDGDGDRIMTAVNGRIYDGDYALYIFAKTAKVKNKAIAGTLMTNLGLEKAFEKIGVKFIRADVGDKYVYREMIKRGLNFGGEASGHLILKDYMETGDGLLASVILAKTAKKFDFETLTSDCVAYPQVNSDILTDKEGIELFKNSHTMKQTVERLKQEALDKGCRAVIRASGTEPRIRIMVEAENIDTATSLALVVNKSISNGLIKK